MDDDGAVRGRRRGRARVPELRRRAAAAVLPGHLAGQPARRPLLPEDLQQAGYDASWLEGEIGLPATVERRPLDQAHRAATFLRLFNLTGPLRNAQMKRDYLNFYGNLISSSDRYLVNVLDTLDRPGLTRRHAGHPHRRPRRDGPGPRRPAAEELQLLRGGDCGSRCSTPTRSSGPGRGQSTPWSPTSTSCRRSRASCGAPRAARAVAGPRLLGPRARHRTPSHPPQDYIVFTFDDYQSGQASGPYPRPPNHIVALREQRWKLAQLLRRRRQRRPAVGDVRPASTDPLERRNLAAPGYAARPLRSGSTSGCGASSRASRRPACSRCAARRSRARRGAARSAGGARRRSPGA